MMLNSAEARQSLQRAIAAVMAAALLAGAGMGGLALSGVSWGLDAHMLLGAAILALALGQAALCLRDAALPPWTRYLGIALLAGAGLQAATGAIHLFALHLPLSLAIFAGEAALAVAPAFGRAPSASAGRHCANERDRPDQQLERGQRSPAPARAAH